MHACGHRSARRPEVAESRSSAVAAACDNVGPPSEMASHLAALARGHLLSPHWTDFCLDLLSRQRLGLQRIPRLLPRGTRVCHKSGTILGVVNAAGVVEVRAAQNRVALAVFIDGCARPHEPLAEAVIARITKAAYDAYAGCKGKRHFCHQGWRKGT